MITSMIAIALLQMNPIILQPFELQPMPQLVMPGPSNSAPAVLPSGRRPRPYSGTQVIILPGEAPITTQQIGRDITVTSQGAKMTTCVRTGMVTSCF